MAVLGLLWILAIAAPSALACLNLPKILAKNDDSLPQFASELARNLPSKPSVVLCDDRVRMLLLMAREQSEKPNGRIFIETSSLNHQEYLLYLRNHYPLLQKYIPDAKHMGETVDPPALIDLFRRLCRVEPVYYLHPSFGYYFEEFYLKPEGLIYELKPYSTGMLQPPPLAPDQIKANENYWDQMRTHTLKSLSLRARQNTNAANAAIVAGFYSDALDFWGVELQKSKLLTNAAGCFNEALELNPGNVSAQINLLYNTRLQKGITQPVDISEIVNKSVSVYHSWVQVLMSDGPVDEPGFNLQFGGILAQSDNLRQAAVQFERRLQLRPNDPDALIAMARTFIDMGRPDKGLDIIRQLQAQPGADMVQLIRLEALARLSQNDFAKAEILMIQSRKEKPGDDSRLDALIEFYCSTGFEALDASQNTKATQQTRIRSRQAANQRFTNALVQLREKQRILSAPGRDTNPSELADILLRESDLLMRLELYPDAIASLTQALQHDPSNPTALLDRAISELNVKKLDAAKDDYNVLLTLLPKQSLYLAYFGLAEIGARGHDNQSAIRYYKRYLKSAPDNTDEYKEVKQKLRVLEGA